MMGGAWPQGRGPILHRGECRRVVFVTYCTAQASLQIYRLGSGTVGWPVLSSARLGRIFVWVALAILLAILFYSLLGACAVRWAGGALILSSCPAADPNPDLARLREAQQSLEAEVRRLELALLDRPLCPIPPEPAPPPTTEPARPAPVPEPPEPPPRPAEPPTPPPVQPAPEPNPSQKPAAIPEAAWDNRDLGFLEGCWDLESDYQLRDVDTGRISSVESWAMCFDAHGNGEQRLHLSDQTNCSSGTRASFTADGRLRFEDTDNVPCVDPGILSELLPGLVPGSYIHRREIDCDRASDEIAQCESFQPETGGRSRVVLRRQR